MDVNSKEMVRQKKLEKERTNFCLHNDQDSRPVLGAANPPFERVWWEEGNCLQSKMLDSQMTNLVSIRCVRLALLRDTSRREERQNASVCRSVPTELSYVKLYGEKKSV